MDEDLEKLKYQIEDVRFAIGQYIGERVDKWGDGQARDCSPEYLSGLMRNFEAVETAAMAGYPTLKANRKRRE